jgi:hypothetical protein
MEIRAVKRLWSRTNMMKTLEANQLTSVAQQIDKMLPMLQLLLASLQQASASDPLPKLSNDPLPRLSNIPLQQGGEPCRVQPSHSSQ